MSYKILTYEEIDKAEWGEFVATHPKGNVFQTPEMYDVFAISDHIKPIVVAVIKDSQIVGILLAQYITNGNAIAAWVTARSIITGGPLARDNDRKIISVLFEAYKKQLPFKTIYSEIRPIYEMNCMNGFGWARKGHYNLVLGVEKTKVELFEQMHKERRRNVNQAIKAGLTFRELEYPEEIHEVVRLIAQTYQRKHVPISYLNIFDKVRQLMHEYAHFFGCFTAEGQMIAGQVRLCYGDLVYAWFAGSDEKFFKLRPNDFLMWNVIVWAHEKGYKWFDFGGGGEPGVEYGVRDYKLKYGCEMYDYGRYTLVHRPLSFEFGTFAYKFYHKIKGK